jgi:serine/threonine protein kinase
MAGEDPVHIPGYDDFVEIGRGGFAVVYRARQTRLRRLVAVKVLNGGDPSPAALARFEHECAAIGALSGHRNVVAVHDAGTTDDGRPYLTMEYLPGGSLAEHLTRGPLPVGEALSIGAQLADALSAAHAAEVLHRDVKPENVLLGDDGTPKLADFGIAVVADAHQTATGVVIGTVLHSAPEVLSGERATVSADVYSLASTVFTLIHGTAAFAGAHDEGVAPIMYRVVHAPVPDLRPIACPARRRRCSRPPWPRTPPSGSAAPPRSAGRSRGPPRCSARAWRLRRRSPPVRPPSHRQPPDRRGVLPTDPDPEAGPALLWDSSPPC